MRRIAFYGKGGIGKTTLAANIAALFAAQGKKVLYIGCDPKGDSCRLLTGGPIPTLMELIGKNGRSLAFHEAVHIGPFGIRCLETGGPGCGTGCTGICVGMLANLLESWDIWSGSWDYVIYDFPGGADCGGHMAPVRSGLADEIFLVSTAECMSLYAVNKILGNLQEAGREAGQFCGLILNRSHGPSDISIAKAFCKHLGTQFIGAVPESPELRSADYRRETLICRVERGICIGAIEKILPKIAAGRASEIKALSPQAFEDFIQEVLEQQTSGGAAM